MEVNNNAGYQTEETSAGVQDSGKSCCFENIKNIIADKLQNVADVMGEKASEAQAQDSQSGRAKCEKHASELFEHSAQFVREFDYNEADAKLRDCVKQHPGRSILIAGGVGLIIGAILRRR